MIKYINPNHLLCWEIFFTNLKIFWIFYRTGGEEFSSEINYFIANYLKFLQYIIWFSWFLTRTFWTSPLPVRSVRVRANLSRCLFVLSCTCSFCLRLRELIPVPVRFIPVPARSVRVYANLSRYLFVLFLYLLVLFESALISPKRRSRGVTRLRRIFFLKINLAFCFNNDQMYL